MKQKHSLKIHYSAAMIAAFCGVLAALCLFGCGGRIKQTAAQPSQTAAVQPAESTPAPTVQPTPTPSPTPYVPETVTVRFVGDLMVSKPMILSALQADGEYDFSEIFTQIRPELQGADLLIGNLETPVAGEENGGFTGNPRFNAPDAYLTALKGAGFNVLTNANNHLLDRGVEGAIATIEKVRDNGFMQTGAFTSPEDAQQLLMMDVRGVKICLLAYSYHSTRTEQAKDREALQWLRNYNDPEKMKADIEKARAQGADVVLIFTHMGTEGTYEPNRLQKAMAQHLVDCGADAAIFCHTHSVQPFERLTAPDGREIFVAYSLGNFLADGKYRMSRSGMLLELPITVDREKGTVSVEQVRYMPSYSHQEQADGRVAFRLYAAGTAMDDETLPEKTRNLAKISWDTVTEVVGEEYATAVKSFAQSE